MSMSCMCMSRIAACTIRVSICFAVYDSLCLELR